MPEQRDNPFPGVNPFIEWAGFWRDFHARLINYVAENLLANLPENYDARIEEEALLIDPDGEATRRVPDVTVTAPDVGLTSARLATPILHADAELHPVPVVKGDPLTHRWIEIYQLDNGQLVTSIEILSPTNKRGRGFANFRIKRRDLLDAGVNLVDIDLLLAGKRLPFQQAMPEADFYGYVSREKRAPMVQIFALKLSSPLRSLPIPLKEVDGDAVLDLQASYNQAFSRGGYARRLRYSSIPSFVDPTIVAWAKNYLNLT